MSLTLLGIAGILILFVLVFLNMPIGLSLAMVGFIGVSIARGLEPGLSVLAIESFRTASTYAFSVIPLFVGMGILASEVRLSSDAFFTLDKWIGHFRGGLAMATTAACAGFAAVSGDPISTSTTVAAAALPEMRKNKYADELSLGCLAAGGNLGFLIPPSLAFIIYAILTEQSIGVLFISGILPGLLLAVLFMSTIWIRCKMRPEFAPQSAASSWWERFRSLRYIIGGSLLIVLVLGSIYAGVCTPSEAGGIGIFGVVVLGLIYRRLTWKGFKRSLHTTARLVGKIFILIIGALIFSRFMVVTEIPLNLAEGIGGLDIPPILVLIIVLIFYILVGTIMDIMSIILLTAPILHPVLVGMGFDPVWLSVLTVITILIGQITPPVGIVVYGLSGYIPDVPVFTIFRGAFPFILAMIVCLILVIVFPQIALLLPNLMRQ